MDIKWLWISLCFFTGTVCGKPAIIDIVDYGARGDGRSLNTGPIQKAIDACHEAGGGTVYIGQGEFISGNIFLKSSVTLYLESGAVLKQSKDMAHYQEPDKLNHCWLLASRFNFIYADRTRNAAIKGSGIIDGDNAVDTGPGAFHIRGPMTINIENSDDFIIEGVTVRNSGGGVAINFYACRNVYVRDVKCYNSFAGAYNISCCQDMFFSGLIIDTSDDDTFCIKNQGPILQTRPEIGNFCKNIFLSDSVIRNSKKGPGAVKIGTQTFGMFRNIHINNCVFENVGSALDIHLMRPNLSTTKTRCIENIFLTNLNVRNADRLIQITTQDVVKPVIRNVILKNIIAENLKNFSIVEGLPEAPVQELTFSDIRIKQKGNKKNCWLYANNVEGLTIDNVMLDLDDQNTSAVIVENARNTAINRFSIDNAKPSAPLINMSNVESVFINNTRSPICENFLFVKGDNSKDISFLACDLSDSLFPFMASDEVQKEILSKSSQALDVEISKLEIPEIIKSGSPVEIKALLKNKGQSGAYRAQCYVNERPAGVKWIWLQAGESHEMEMNTDRIFLPGRKTVQMGQCMSDLFVESVPGRLEYGKKMQILVPESHDGGWIKTEILNAGGEEIDQDVELYDGDNLVASKRVRLRPGQKQEIRIPFNNKGLSEAKLKLGDFPVWSFLTYANTEAYFYQDRDKITIVANGDKKNAAEPDFQYGAVYLKDVEGDYVATVRILDQKKTGAYCGTGFMIRNDMSSRTSGGMAVLTMHPLFGGLVQWAADFDSNDAINTEGICYPWALWQGGFPFWFKIRRQGNYFKAYVSEDGDLWHIPQACPGKSPYCHEGILQVNDAASKQDIALIVSANNESGKLSESTFDHFSVEQEIPLDTIVYKDLALSNTMPLYNEPLEITCTIRNQSAKKGMVGVPLMFDNHEPFTKWLDMEPGQTQTVTFRLSPENIRHALWIAEPGTEFIYGKHDIRIGNTEPVPIEIQRGEFDLTE